MRHTLYDSHICQISIATGGAKTAFHHRGNPVIQPNLPGAPLQQNGIQQQLSQPLQQPMYNPIQQLPISPYNQQLGPR